MPDRDPVMATWPDALARNAPRYLRAASLKEMRILVEALGLELLDRACAAEQGLTLKMAADALALCVDRLDEILRGPAETRPIP